MKDENNYSTWAEYNKERLKVKYNECNEKNYNRTMPDTWVNFDDFCVGQWQCREI